MISKTIVFYIIVRNGLYIVFLDEEEDLDSWLKKLITWRLKLPKLATTKVKNKKPLLKSKVSSLENREFQT